MELFTQLFGNALAFVYHCFDRIVIYGYLSGLSRPEQVVHFFRHSLPRRRPGSSALPWSARRSSANAPPTIKPGGSLRPQSSATDRVGRKGSAQGRSCPALATRMARQDANGVYFIFKSMEQGATFRVSVPKYASKDPNYRILARQRSRFTRR
jgi:hypothetical protein